MSFQFLFPLAGIIVCLIVSAAAMVLLGTRKFYSPAWTALLLTALAAAVGLFEPHPYNDFISEMSVWCLFAPLTAALPLALTVFAPLPIGWRTLLIFVCAAAAVFGGSIPTVLVFAWPLWLNQLLIVGAWTLCAVSFGVLNYIPTAAAAQTACTAGAVFLLYILGAAPFILGIEGLCLAAAVLPLLFYRLPDGKPLLNTAGAELLGFILSGILALEVAEGGASALLIFLLYPLFEFVFAAGQKLTFLPRYQNLPTDTALAKAVAQGLNLELANQYVVRINILLILFGCFQVYAPNWYSMLIICALATAWQMLRLTNLNVRPLSFGETNRQIMSELKKNATDLKNNLNRIKRKK